MNCQDVFDEDVDELTLISNEFKNIASSRKKEGYKEGMEQGQQVHMQEGFDQGFKQGFASNVLMSKVKGILNGLLEFQLYDGNPITENIVLETQLCIDAIDQLEADHVIDDLLDLNLNKQISTSNDSGCGGNCTCGKYNNNNNDEEDMEVNLDLMQLNNDQQISDRNKSNLTIGNRSIKLLDPRQIEKKIEESNKIREILNQCQQVLKKLGWNDELNNLLSTAD